MKPIFRLTLFALLTGFFLNAQAAVKKTPATPPHKKTMDAHQHLVKLKKQLSVNNSVLEKRNKDEEKASKIPFGIAFDQPTYILPFYYTQSPDQDVYRGSTPDGQKIMRAEFKAQLSFQLPLWHHLFNKHTSLYFSYTQLAYWQIYAKSQYFRETDYEPALYVQSNLIGLKNATWQAGLVHQSNGRGGTYERSWNRAYVNIRFSGRHWLISLEPWLLVFKHDSSDLHNSNIASYLGHGKMVFAYKTHRQTFSLMMRNNLESGFQRGAIEIGYSFPLIHKLDGFIQFFSGYGQSLIEYNHYTNSAGIGIMLSNWI
jgi:phospholipase A1/A2